MSRREFDSWLWAECLRAERKCGARYCAYVMFNLVSDKEQCDYYAQLANRIWEWLNEK